MEYQQTKQKSKKKKLKSTRTPKTIKVSALYIYRTLLYYSYYNNYYKKTYNNVSEYLSLDLNFKVKKYQPS